MAVMKHLNELLEVAQIIHITGSLDWNVIEKAVQELPAHLQPRYHAMPYSHEMGAALAAAALVLARAGASSLGEYHFFGLPAVFVPYPYAWRYQKVNADFLAERYAAVILQDELLKDKLLPVIKDLLLNNKKLEAMRAAMKKLSRPNAASVIATSWLNWQENSPYDEYYLYLSMYVLLFAVIGAMRGWAKELLVAFSVITVGDLLLEKYIPCPRSG